MANSANNIPLKFNGADFACHHEPQLPKEKRSVGQSAADALTRFCGSWTFIIALLCGIVGWIILNIIAWEYNWDPAPFILLNLVLACFTSLQAPIILMSQKRAAERDRMSQRYDYLIDRKTGRDAEKILGEIKGLEKKLNKLIKSK